MFDPKFPNYGVVKIENGNVRVYSDQYTYNTISIGNAINAMWAGNCLNVTLSDGRVRRYSDLYTYNTI